MTVRNQTVLLRGVNDNVETMGALIRELADMVIHPVSTYPPVGEEGGRRLLRVTRTVLRIPMRYGPQCRTLPNPLANPAGYGASAHGDNRRIRDA